MAKKTKSSSAPKKAPAIITGAAAPAKPAEAAPAKAADTPAPKAADAAAKPADTAPAKTDAGESGAPKNYSRGEGQKPVTQAYKDNWNLIFGKGAKKKKR